MGFFLSLNALNFAEADHPFNRLGGRQLAEMYFALGLQCHLSIPYASSLPMVRRGIEAAFIGDWSMG